MGQPGPRAGQLKRPPLEPGISISRAATMSRRAWELRNRQQPSLLDLQQAEKLEAAPSHGPAERPRQQWRSTLAVERRLAGLLLPHWPMVLLGVAVTVLDTVVGLAKPWPMKVLVDSALGTHPFFGLGHQASLLVAVLATLVLFLLAGGLGLAQTAVLFGLSQRLIAGLRERTFEHLTRLSLRYHDDKGTGDSLFRVANDTYAVQSVLLDGVLPLVASTLAIGGTLAVLFGLDPVFAVLAMVSVPAAAVASRRFTQRINRASRVLQERESDVYAHAERTLGGIRTVQAFARERHETALFRELVLASRRAMLRLVTAQTLFGLVVDLVLAVGLALITYVAARRALSGVISVGEVLVVITYTGSLYAPISGFAANFGQLKAAAAAAQRVFQVLDQEPPPTRYRGLPPIRRAQGRIGFDEVVFGYRPDKPVLRGVEFSAAPGETVAVVGPTGAGKSSIASLLLRLYDPDEGRVTLDGADLRELPLAWLREQIAFVPQEPVLLASTLRENIRYGRLDAGDGDVYAAAQAANLGEFLADADGLDVAVGDRGVMLSGGQRQRVAIARAMLKDAPVLVLDEPTSALDAGTEAGVMEAVERLFSDRTVLVIAHRLATVQRANQVLVVERGQIVQRGTHSELARRSGRYRALHESRFGSSAVFPRAAG